MFAPISFILGWSLVAFCFLRWCYRRIRSGLGGRGRHQGEQTWRRLGVPAIVMRAVLIHYYFVYLIGGGRFFNGSITAPCLILIGARPLLGDFSGAVKTYDVLAACVEPVNQHEAVCRERSLVSLIPQGEVLDVSVDFRSDLRSRFSPMS